MNTVDLITKKTKLLPVDKQDQILDFVEFLIVKYQQEISRKSAEQRAIDRLKDVDDIDNPELWETVIEIDDDIDIESSLENLRKRGYKIKIPRGILT
ncbi:hypothetical protein [Geminocystis sp. NIES-3709]|uniref:hypothetical protein n=1 Tax=Geminocystis sp. NIES-3709 TaxID=1617448 RepID=UPI0005FC55CD|nr:hypothetical protein [Geminocystis sp. NIES-3709]BAQ66051.1 hypothetical protein GM3709_2816 [Geminocystis sp. NIES-3709]